MKNSIKISVVIPVYNVENYIGQCLHSILNQTLKEIEVICVNDGSTDKSLSILEKYSKIDDRIKVIDQQNQGAGYSRNLGLELASGNYVHFMDSDDYMELNAYECLYNKAIEFGADIVKGKSYALDNKTKEKLKRSAYELSNIGKNNFDKLISFYDSPNKLIKTTLVPWNGICKKSFLIDNKINFNNLTCVNDHTFFYEVIIKSKKLLFINNFIINHRVNRGNSLIGQRAKHFYCEFISFRITEDLVQNLPREHQLLFLNNEIKDIMHFYKKFKDDETYGYLISLQTKEFFKSIGFGIDLKSGNLYRLE